MYASVPMSKDAADRALSDRSLSRQVKPWQWDQADAYNVSIEEQEDLEDAGLLPEEDQDFLEPV